MDHAGDDVFARAALPLDQHRHIGRGHFVQAFPQSLHRLGAAKHHRIGRNFA